MCSAMNSLEIFRPYNMKRSKPFFINESQQSDKFNTDYIPYLSEPFDEKPIVELNDILYFQYNNNNNNNSKMETNDNNELNLNAFDNWGDMTEDDVVGFQDDNVSHVDSDYSEHPTTEQDNLYAQSNPLDVAYGSSGGEISDSEVKCNPTEYILRPPSGSVMHLSYNIPVMPIQNEPTSSAAAEIMRRKAAMMNNTKIPHAMYGSQQDMDGNNSLPAAAPAASTSNYPTDAHSNPGCFHPNMWYPNASFGSYSSYGSNHAYGRQYGPQISHDHMVDMFQLSNSGREARNRAEKNRRDKLNSSIQELSTMVPHVAESPRRVDKTAVLRFAAHGLRLKYVFGKSLNNEPTRSTDALMKLLDSFFLTLTCNGHIVLVSSSIEQHLGHCQTDLYGQNILHITHPDDHQMLKEKLIPTNLDNLLDIQPEDESGEPRQRTQAEEDEIDRRLQEDKRNFTIRLARSGPRSEPTAYELVKIDGSFRRSDNAPRGLKTSTFPSTIQLMRRSRGREDIMPLHTISGNDIVLIAIARIVRPPAITPLKEVNSFEYKSRHLIDGRIIDCDKRIGLVAGYMLDEVLNLSPFTFIHQDDVPWVIVALRQMYDCNNSSSGESAYRLFARTGKFIYLHSKGFLEIDKNTNRVHSFICINTLLSEEEGKRHIEKMKKKFSVVIDTQIPKSINDAPASENPQQLEKSVLCLIQDLKSELDNNNDVEASTSTSTSFSQQSPHYNNSNPYSTSTLPQMPDLSGIDRPTNPPPLAIVPPATDSVQNSITENVSAVNTTTERYLGSNTNSYQQQHQLSAPEGHCRNESSQNPIASIDLHHNCRPDQETERHTYTPIGTVKRKLSLNSEINDADEYKVPIQRQAIESVLSDSLTRINNRLNRQLNAAIELRDQSQTYEVPHTEERIANIMQEHQAQQEMYEHINNEFQVHRECSEISGSNSDSELIRGNNGNSLEQIQQQQQQQQQQNSNVSVPIATEVTATTLSSSNASDSDAQLCPNNNDNNNSEL